MDRERLAKSYIHGNYKESDARLKYLLRYQDRNIAFIQLIFKSAQK